MIVPRKIRELESSGVTTSDKGSVFAELMHTLRVASLGQITHTLYEVGGQYRRAM